MPRIAIPAEGLTKLAAAIGGGGDASYQAGAEQGALLQSKLAQALSSIKAQDAQARLHGAQADEAVAQNRMRDPTLIRNNAMTLNNVPLDAADDVQSYLQSGRLPPKYDALPDDQAGPFLPKPEFTPRLGNVARAIAATNTALTLGDKNSKNVAEAAGSMREQQLGDDMIAGRVDPTKVATSQYALKGSAPYHFSEFGVGNNLTGGLDASNPVATRYGVYRQSETDKNVKQGKASDASAAASYASAAERRAQTDRIKQEIDMGKAGSIQSTDQGLIVVDPRAGTSRPVVGPDGKPVGRPNASKNLTEGQAKANLFGGRMMESNAILNKIAGPAFNGTLRPGMIKSGAEAVAGMVPFVGDNLANVAGNATNFTQSADQQSVEQAERDYLNAVLRRESGAVIGPSEFANGERQYFPRPGDSVQVLKQKAANRARATELMLAEVPEPLRYKPKQPDQVSTKNVTVDY